MGQVICTVSSMTPSGYLEFLAHIKKSDLLMSIFLTNFMYSMYLSVLLHEYLFMTVSTVLMFLKISMVICHFNPHLSM